MTEQYSIRDLAEEFQVTTRTLRFYEEKGLLQPSREKQSRLYNAADRTRLKLILRGKRLGFTLEESSQIISMYDPTAGNKKQIQSLVEKIREKKDILKQQQKDLKLMLLDLDGYEKRCLASIEGTRFDIKDIKAKSA